MEMEPFDLYSPLIDADPFPYYAVLRDKFRIIGARARSFGYSRATRHR